MMLCLSKYAYTSCSNKTNKTDDFGVSNYAYAPVIDQTACYHADKFLMQRYARASVFKIYVVLKRTCCFEAADFVALAGL